MASNAKVFLKTNPEIYMGLYSEWWWGEGEGRGGEGVLIIRKKFASKASDTLGDFIRRSRRI